MRHAARIDDNHKIIVHNLRQCGYSVLSLAAVGKGCPDILVGAAGKNILMEIKDGSKSPSRRKLTPEQRTFFSSWAGQAVVVTCLSEALDAVKEAVACG